MKNEDFLDILGNIDDSIIDECTADFVPSKKHRYQKQLLTFAAVFLMTVCAVFITKISPDGFLTGFFGEEHSLSENYTHESTAYPEETTIEQSTESFVTEEQSFSETVTDTEATEHFIPEATTAEITLPPEKTTEEQLSTESTSPFFVEVSYDSFVFAETDGLPDDSSDSKRVTWKELLRIYGRIILPSVIGEYFPGFQAILGDPDFSVSDSINTEEENFFSFILPDSSTLNIYVSNHGLSLRQVEEENMAFASEIEGVSALLLKGCDAENEMIFSAYFQKNGVYFRITQQGTDLSEKDFVNIIESLI